MNDISKNTNQNLNLQTCCICLEEQTEFEIENNNRLVEYNHCGRYYIHNKCLNKWNKWKSNECLICRKKFNENTNENYSNHNDNESDNDIITIIVDQNYRSFRIKCCVNFCIMFNLLGIGLYFLLRNN